jgi:hypothetical protein
VFIHGASVPEGYDILVAQNFSAAKGTPCDRFPSENIEAARPHRLIAASVS